MRKWLQGLGGHQATAAIAGVLTGAGVALAASPVTVRQTEKTFSPDVLTVERGTQVEFTNEDPYIHHIYVESPALNFDSGEQRPGRRIAIRFDTAGDYSVRCAIHLKMLLRVNVR
jgi:plastocyanin